MYRARSATSSGSLRKVGILVRNMKGRFLMVSGALCPAQVGLMRFVVP
jgi:hypothetical protein